MTHKKMCQKEGVTATVHNKSLYVIIPGDKRLSINYDVHAHEYNLRMVSLSCFILIDIY